MKMEVIWTALPNGVEKGKLKLSVFATHRLYGSDGTLASGSYSDASGWASKTFGFKVVFPGQFGGNPAPGDVRVASTLQPTLWASMMKGDTPVKAYQLKSLAAMEIHTLSTHQIEAMVETAYQAALELHPGELLPSKPWLEQYLAAFAPLRAARLAPQLVDSKAAPSMVKPPVQPLADERERTAQLRKDYDAKVKTWRSTGSAPLQDAAGYALVAYEAMAFHEPFVAHALKLVPQPDVDYHQALSSLASYPELLRAFGLVFDLEVAVPAGLAGSGLVQVAPTYTPKDPGTVDHLMQTAYRFGAGGDVFVAQQETGSDIVDGMLGIGKGNYLLTEIDLDGTALKLMNTVSAQVYGGPPDADAGTTLPSLQSAGLALHQNDRISMVKAKLARADALHEDTAQLHLDDLVRGYRIDIFDRGQWRSLCERTGSYSVAGQPVAASIEGWVSSGMTSAPGDPGDGPKKLHECLARWTGWSLAVPRPGKHLDEQGNLVDEPDLLQQHFPLQVKLDAPKGSLPPLRFGREYKMRARAVDLAGNGPTNSAASSGVQESETVAYTRFDPVAAPGMYPVAPVGFGESEYNVVVRKFKSGDPVQPTQRIVVPPEGGEALCEHHGMFDLPGGGVDPDAYANVIQPRDAAAPLGSVIQGPLQDMPYLVDPMVRGAAVGYTPPEPPEQKRQAEFVSIAFPGSWPKMGSVTLTAKPVSGRAHPQPTQGTAAIEIPLRPGEVVEAQIASATMEERFTHLGLANWRPVITHPVLRTSSAKFAAAAFEPAHVARLTTPSWTQQVSAAAFKTSVVEGKVWLITPWRGFTLVFATQVPELPASFTPSPPIVYRLPGDTSLAYGYEVQTGSGTASNRTVLQTHAWSTDEVEARANWIDEVDLIQEQPRKTEKQQRHGTAFKVLVGRDEFSKPLRERHELGDTKHHELSYVLRAHSRFRRYFDPKWAESEFLRDSDPIAFHAPSTASPADLPLEYVIPTFGWSVEGPDRSGGLKSTRSGNGLRVYLRRPWFSSGNGERLAVVLPSGTVSSSDPLGKFVTAFGGDPVFAGGNVPNTASTEHFKGSVSAGPVQIQEVPDAAVALASYPVQFDAERQLWYADIEIDLGPTAAYMPFVKLALARYQEHSLSGLELGHVATADFMQLTPDRVASVVWAQDGKSFRASVAGVLPRLAATPGMQGRLVIGTVEEKSGADPDAAWRPTAVDGKELEGPVPFAAIGGVELSAAGQFVLPTDRTAKKYRLVIREYEALPSDFQEEATPQGPMAMMPARMGRRLVYLDVLPLS